LWWETRRETFIKVVNMNKQRIKSKKKEEKATERGACEL